MARRKQAPAAAAAGTPAGDAALPKGNAAVAHDESLYEFAVEFFSLFGGEVRADGGRGAKTLRVDLPADLATHFGREQLALCFAGAEPQAGQELVAHGSRTFDRMIALLEQRSAFTVQRLPQRATGGDELLRAVQPANAAIQELKLQEQLQWLFALTWRITYRADDKRQELYTVVVDETGVRVPQAGEPDAGAGAVDVAALLAEAEPAPIERDEEDHILPPKLLPVTQLGRVAAAAQRYAIYHADVRCVSYEADILPRLHKSLNRLIGYYQQQIEEVYDSHDPDGEKRRVLELDLNRKIAEEVENHRLHVTVELVSYVALERPATVLEMTLSDGKRQVPVRAVQDRYSGAIRRPVCAACGKETATVVLDRGGHIICDDCLRQCATCAEVLCERCGVEQCPVCAAVNCDTCGRMCAACGQRACPQHSSRCPVCGDEVCHACQSECAACGVLQCRSHLQADNHLRDDGGVELICATCAVRCPGCRQYTAHLGTCTTSGQRFCLECLMPCAICGRLVGPGFYNVSPLDGKPYCNTCRVLCPRCGTVTPLLVNCKTCGAAGCPVCTPYCAECGAPVCQAHGHKVEACGHILCDEHVGRCAIDRAPVCLACSPPCAICGRPYCAGHASVCGHCGQEYCSECVGGNGTCKTCGGRRDGEPLDLTGRPWAKDPQVAPLLSHYRWTRRSNDRYFIYVGEGSMLNGAVIVVRKADPGARSEASRVERVVAARRVGALERLRGMFGS